MRQLTRRQQNQKCAQRNWTNVCIIYKFILDYF